MIIQQAIDEFIFHCKIEKQLNEKTLKAYSIDLKQFCKFLALKNVDTIEKIGKYEIKQYLLSLSKNSPKTIKRKIATAKAFFNLHEFEENILFNPFRKVKATVKIPSQLPTVMNLNQIEKILSVVYQAKESIENKKKYAFAEKVRDIAVLELLFATGIRVSELCSLNINDFDPNFSCITVNGKGSKQRKVPITNEFVKNAIKEYYSIFKADIHQSFFVNRLKNQLSSQSVRLMVKRYSKEADIPKNVTPHIFRHSFATLLLEQDVDIRYIQNILGHSSINTTQIYTHVNNKKKFEILTQKHPRNNLNVIHE
ncbi:MAG: tyrosine-type recombinase/integrase [Carboxylicivirga sp.]|jgi:integrase/recombinase XerD|nr:tyrosine-type recombinase/integrase [Carboxylicivirga sp.]